jgi:excisionase family DNA binding protein
MIEQDGHCYLTVREAAARVERTRRTIETWLRDEGLRVYYPKGKRLRLVREDQLLRVLRRKLRENPARRHAEV